MTSRLTGSGDQASPTRGDVSIKAATTSRRPWPEVMRASAFGMGGAQPIGQGRRQLGELDRRHRQDDADVSRESLDVTGDDLAASALGLGKLGPRLRIGRGMDPKLRQEPPPGRRHGILAGGQSVELSG